MKSSRPGLRPILVRLWRLGLLAAAILVIRNAAQTHENLAVVQALAPERLRDFFPSIHSLGLANPASGWRPTLDASGQTLGYATTTHPGSDKIIGYSGPSHCLLVFDLKGSLQGLRLLKSHDTTEHVAEVVADRKFFTQFQNLKPGELLKQPLHVVTGATLTSTAIAQGVLEKLGQSASTSLRFPDEITLAEVEQLEPDADRLTPSSLHRGGLDVLDDAGQKIGIAVRTSPVSDTIRTSGWSISGWPTESPRPQTTLTTPFGKISAISWARRSVVSGVCSEGLMTTQFPMASAGAIFQAIISRGKFQGMTWPTTPSGFTERPGATYSSLSAQPA